MLKYIWAPTSRVYHDRDEINELCNTDDITHRKESDSLFEAKGVKNAIYARRRFCTFCRRRKERRLNA